MRMVSNWKLALGGLVLGVLPALATAEIDLYGGLGLGYIAMKQKQEPFQPEPNNDPTTLFSRDLEGSATASKQFLGIRLGRFVAVEGGFTRFSTVNDNTFLASPGFDVGQPYLTGDYGVKVNGYDVYGVGLWPINSDLEVFGKVGAVKWDRRIVLAAGDFSGTTKDDGTDLAYGVGLNLGTTGPFKVRLEAQAFDIEGLGSTWNVIASGIYVFRLQR
jgi:hypothetical protein